jgi:hypothetical protein
MPDHQQEKKTQEAATAARAITSEITPPERTGTPSARHGLRFGTQRQFWHAPIVPHKPK